MSLPKVRLWSFILVVVSLVSILTVVIIDITSWTVAGEASIEQPWHALLFSGSLALGLAAFIAHVASRILAGQRRILDALNAQAGTPDVVGGAPDNVRAFILGRRVGRADRAPTVLP